MSSTPRQMLDVTPELVPDFLIDDRARRLQQSICVLRPEGPVLLIRTLRIPAVSLPAQIRGQLSGQSEVTWLRRELALMFLRAGFCRLLLQSPTSRMRQARPSVTPANSANHMISPLKIDPRVPGFQAIGRSGLS